MHINPEYRSVCPLVRIGPLTPSPPTECVPHPEPKGGGTHSPAGEGAEVPIRATGEKSLVLCLQHEPNNAVVAGEKGAKTTENKLHWLRWGRA